MYSPVIREDLIPLIYRAAKSESIPMTAWVNQAVENALVLREQARTEEQRKKNECKEGDMQPSAN